MNFRKFLIIFKIQINFFTILLELNTMFLNSSVLVLVFQYNSFIYYRSYYIVRFNIIFKNNLLNPENLTLTRLIL